MNHPLENGPASKPRVRERKALRALRCPYCRDFITEEPVVRCSACALALHIDCAGELERCPSLGCAGRPELAAEAAPRDRILLELWRFRPINAPCRIETSPRASGLILEPGGVFAGPSSEPEMPDMDLRLVGAFLVILVMVLVFAAAPPSGALVLAICLALAGLAALLSRPFLQLADVPSQLSQEPRGRLAAVRSLARELRLELADLRSGRAIIVTFPARREIEVRASEGPEGPRLVVGEVITTLPRGWDQRAAAALAEELERVRRHQGA